MAAIGKAYSDGARGAGRRAVRLGGCRSPEKPISAGRGGVTRDPTASDTRYASGRRYHQGVQGVWEDVQTVPAGGGILFLSVPTAGLL